MKAKLSYEIAAVMLTVCGRREPISAEEFAAVSAWAWEAMPAEERNDMALKLIYASRLEAYEAIWAKLERPALQLAVNNCHDNLESDSAAR